MNVISQISNSFFDNINWCDELVKIRPSRSGRSEPVCTSYEQNGWYTLFSKITKWCERKRQLFLQLPAGGLLRWRYPGLRLRVVFAKNRCKIMQIISAYLHPSLLICCKACVRMANLLQLCAEKLNNTIENE
jgi:hypothetical protein